MPKASKPRTTARSDPLASKDANTAKQTKAAVKSAAKSTKKTTSSTAKKQAKSVKKQAEPDSEVVETAASAAAPNSASSSPADAYLLLIRLNDTFEPTITRLLSVPSNFTFQQLHLVIQAAFGWANCHAHSFEVSKIIEGEQSYFLTGRGKQLLHIVPFFDPSDKDDYPDPEKTKAEDACTLADIYDSDDYRGKVEVSYEYDHGDSWDHGIDFLGRADPSMRKAMQIPDDFQAFCLSGEGHPCAEDCGSTPGWEELKKTFKKRSDPEGMKDWYKHQCANGDPKGLDPYQWDLLEVNDALLKIK